MDVVPTNRGKYYPQISFETPSSSYCFVLEHLVHMYCTMSQKNLPVILVPAHNPQKELERLYARRYAIDDLIESLEKYDRCHADEPQSLELRTA